MEKEYDLLCYTRKPLEDAIYSEKLAYSMHLAISEDGEHYIPLNHNSGILYAKAVSRAEGTLHAKSLKNPRLYRREDGSFGVIAERIETDGSEDTELLGKWLVFRSDDLIHYQELGAVNAEEPDNGLTAAGVLREAGSQSAKQDGTAGARQERLLAGGFTQEELTAIEGQLEGAVPGNVLRISEEQARRLKCRFLTPVNVANEVPESVKARSREELGSVHATARYSDGSSLTKRVDWYADKVDWNMPGEYEVLGKVHQEQISFPVAWDRADPCIGHWRGKYYFIATNDADGNNSFYIREADTIPGLVTAQEVKLLDTQMYPHLKGLLWAPEFHVINGRLYIFHAGTPGPFEQEQSHVMALKSGGNPMCQEDWEMPVRVVRQDGSALYGEQGITLDMTEFEAGGEHYVCWSQRQFKPVDQGAWLYIAKLNPEKPWQLASEPVLLSQPEYGWANNHTFVDEGPYVIKRDGMIYMTFSSAAVDSTYVTGLLSAKEGDDLLVRENWVKENCPLLSSRSVPTHGSRNGYTADQSLVGEFGPGHNSFAMDEDGMLWFVYHAKRTVDGARCTGLRRLHFNMEGFPVLDMTEELDLKPELTWVKTRVIVR